MQNEKSRRAETSSPHEPQIDKKYLRLIEELSKSEQEKAVILDAMTELVLFLDTDLRVIWANKAMLDAFNLKPGQLNGKHCYKALHKRSRACSICPAEKTLKTGAAPRGRRYLLVQEELGFAQLSRTE